MKQFLLILLCTSCFFAQTPNTVLSKKIIPIGLFSDYDIVLIDSLLMDTKYKSPLYEKSTYIINDIEENDVPKSKT
jgi:membrane-bound lytic murein transglycosylase D